MQQCVFSFTVIPVLAHLWLAASSAFQENSQARLGRQHKPGTVPSEQPECSHSGFEDENLAKKMKVVLCQLASRLENSPWPISFTRIDIALVVVFTNLSYRTLVIVWSAAWPSLAVGTQSCSPVKGRCCAAYSLLCVTWCCYSVRGYPELPPVQMKTCSN